MLVGIFSATAKSWSQQTDLKLDYKNATIKQVLNNIEDQSNYDFIYNNNDFNVERKVDIIINDGSIQEILDRLLEKTGMGYKIMDHVIIISPKEVNNFSKIEDQAKKTITGKVTDSNGSSLPGVTVVVKGTTNGSITDSEGNYNLAKISGDAILVFSFIGMKAQEISIAGKSSINIIMQEETFGIDEVVAVGYGTQKRETLTGSISAVKSNELLKAPVTNVSNSLGGRLAGLVSVTSSGEPGYDGTTLRIRGSNTFNDNSVLIVVDGVPGRSLERIDPNSIESVTVLKDASAAIYGSRAANGVILITTKRGNLGKPELTFNTNFGFNQPTKIPKMADAATYATLLNEVEYYDNPEKGLNSLYSTAQIQKFKDGSDPLNYPNTDWFKTVLKPWSAQNSQNATISGGTDALKYFVSLGTIHQDGNYYNSASYYNQYNFRSNIDGKITKDIRIGFVVAGRLEDRHSPIRSASEIFMGIVQAYPTSVAVWPGGEFGPALEKGNNPKVVSTDAAGYNNDKYYKLTSNLKLEVNIPWVKGLTFSGNFSYDQGFDFRKTFSQPFKLYALDHIDDNGNPVLISKTWGGGFNNTPSLNEYFRNDNDKLGNAIFNYQTKIGENNNLKLMVGAEVHKGNTENFSAYRDLFLSTAIQELFAGGTTYQTTDGSGSENTRLSYFSRANYNYANKYLVEFIGRYDGSYIFPANKRFGFFPGVSMGWVASEENFWKDNIGFINYFKLRGSWGQTGNDRVGAFQYLTSYLLGYQYNTIKNTNYNYPFVTYSGSATTELRTLYESVLANNNITWEVANQSNIGFNAVLLNNKLSIEADYFLYKRKSILWQPSANVPASAGISLPDVNYGKVSNQGVDGSITYQDKSTTKFGYSVSINAGYAKNKVIEWGETPGVPVWQQTTGHPMGSDLYYQTNGIYHNQAEIDADNLTYELTSTPTLGDVRFVDYNKDGKINSLDMVRTYKNNIPPLTFGSTIDMNYKGFDLSILLQGATGGVAYVTSEAGKYGNYLQRFANARWTPDNTSANGARTFNRGNWYWTSYSNTYFLNKTDYIRLKTLQFGYTIPSQILKQTGINKLRVYVSGYNLFTYCPGMKDFDPEMGASSSDRGSSAQIRGYNYPLERVVSMGLQLGF